MQIGILSSYDKKKVEAEISKGNQVMLGAELNTLLDEINLLEIQHGYDLSKVIAELKYNCMMALGKIEVAEEAPGQQTKKGELKK